MKWAFAEWASGCCVQSMAGFPQQWCPFHFVQSRASTEMLLRVQNTTGELYLEIGMTQEGFHYFQKAWSNLMEFPPSSIKDNQAFLKQKGTADRCGGGRALCFGVGLLGQTQLPSKGTWMCVLCAPGFCGGHMRVDQSVLLMGRPSLWGCRGLIVMCVRKGGCEQDGAPFT